MLHEFSIAESDIRILLRESLAAVLRESCAALAAVLRDAAGPVPLDRDSLTATVEAIGAARKREISRHLHTAELASAAFAALREDVICVARALGEASSSPDTPQDEPDGVVLTACDVIEQTANAAGRARSDRSSCVEGKMADEQEAWRSGRFDTLDDSPLCSAAIAAANKTEVKEVKPPIPPAVEPAKAPGKRRSR